LPTAPNRKSSTRRSSTRCGDADRYGSLPGRRVRAPLRPRPANTYVTVTADHGELFGESGTSARPINHEKVFEVPFVEGRFADVEGAR
jgi:hypothetical protein